MLGLIDDVEVARYVAFKDTAQTAAERTRKAELKKQKEALVQALHTQCKCALGTCYASLHEASSGCVCCSRTCTAAGMSTVHTLFNLLSTEIDVCRALLAKASKAEVGSGAELDSKVDSAYNELRKWVDVKEAEYVGIHAGREARRGRFAGAIKVCMTCTNFID